MARRKRAPELRFQDHVAEFLTREHGFGVLEQAEIEPEHCIAEDRLWAFLTTTQADSIKKLTDDYGSEPGARCSRPCTRNWPARCG